MIYISIASYSSSVVEIGYDVFRKCRRLTDVYVDQPESDLLNKVGLPYGCIVHWKQAEAI